MNIINILLELTIYSALIFCFIMLFKKLFGKHISPALHYWIWMLLVLRLLVPVTVDSGVSLYNVAVRSVDIDAQAENDMINSTNVSINAMEASTPGIDFSQQSDSFDQTGMAKQAVKEEPINWSKIFLYIWITGIGFSLIYLVVSFLYLKKRILKSAISPNKKIKGIYNQSLLELEIRKGIPLILQKEIKSPALLIYPAVLIPADIIRTMDSQQIAFTIKHELMHYKRKDHIVCLLLSLLQAIYWFNPFVWFAYRQIRLDMEVACDRMMVNRMNKEGRFKYAEMILSLFSRKRQEFIMMSMATGNMKKTAKKRITGIYMNDKSSCKGKLITAILIVIILFSCFTTACQPTPEKPVVIGKNNDLEEKIMQTATPYQFAQSTGSQNQYEIWQDNLEFEGGVKIIIDAEIEKSIISSYPVFSVVPHAFTQEEAQRLVDVFMNGQPVYEYDDMRTKKDFEQDIIKIQAIIEAVKNDASLSETQRKSDLEIYTQELDQLMEDYNNAPDNVNRKPGSVEFKEYQYGSDCYYAIELESDLGKSDPATLRIRLSEDNLKNTVVFKNQDENTMYLSGFEATDELAGLSITRTEAQNEAQTILKKLGMDYMQLFAASVSMDVADMENEERSTVISDPDIRKCYVFSFCRIIDNVPITDLHPCSGIQSDESSNFDKIWRQEELRINVDDSGVVGFYWSCPGDVEDTLNSNVQMIGLDEIKDIFKKQICYQRTWSVPDVTNSVITINAVKLSMMRIKVMDGNSYILIPVWDFIGDWTSTANKVENTTANVSFLTVNAIDGSVINRSLGY